MNPEKETNENQQEWEMRPCGMLVQRRENGDDFDGVNGGPSYKIKVSYGSTLHDFILPCKSTFGDLKRLLARETGLEPEDQRLFFRGREKDDLETLHMAGLKDHSKLLLMERPASKERKMEEESKKNEILKACQAIAQVQIEVDKLFQKVSSLQASVNTGTKVNEKEFIILTELLMVQLLKLDSIEAEGEAKAQRKAEKTIKREAGRQLGDLAAVRRVQGYVDLLDSLKTRNANPFGDCGNTVAVNTNWETFDSGVGSLTPPSTSSSTKTTQDWERFE